MITIEAARQIILESLPPRRVEKVHFQAVLHRVLADTLTATMDVPPFDRAAVDGFALQSADAANVPVELELAGEVRAGIQTSAKLRQGETIAVTTGTPVPAGADAVQMVENARVSEDGRRVTILRPATAGENIIRKSLEAEAGAPVLEAGRLLGPAEIAVLATFGYLEAPVFARPTVAVLATGDELVEVAETPGPGCIRNSNAYSLTAQVNLLGIQPDYLGIAADAVEDLRDRIAEGIGRDVMIISGGASVGPYDLVKKMFSDLGIRILFERVAMRPGKPTIFAVKGDHLVFGLPGNPVSSFVAFENFVRPALGRMCGYARPDLERIVGKLGSAMHQTPGRTAFLPAVALRLARGWRIDPLPWHGSGDILSFSRANALVIFPGDRKNMSESETAEALLLPDFLLRRR